MTIYGISGTYAETYANANNITFVGQEEIPDFVAPASLTVIETEAFANCAFCYAALSENTTEIQSLAFANCPNLYQIYIPAATTTIDRTAFSGCGSLTVLGVSGSYAETFANSISSITFIAIG